MSTKRKVYLLGFLVFFLTICIAGAIYLKTQFKLIQEHVTVEAYSILDLNTMKPFNEGLDYRKFEIKVGNTVYLEDEFETDQASLADTYGVERESGSILVEQAMTMQLKDGMKSYLFVVDVKKEALPSMEIRIHDTLVEDLIEVGADTQLEDIVVSAVRTRFGKPYVDKDYAPITMDVDQLKDGENIINVSLGSADNEVKRTIIVDRIAKTEITDTKPNENKPDGNKPDGNKPDENKPDGNKPSGVKTALHMNTPYIYINREYGMPANYVPNNLVEFPRSYAVDSGYRGVKEMVDAFVAMVDTMEKETGNRILNTSSYRPYSSQERLYNNYVAQHGQAEADRISAKPGHSEHQTGLVVDVVTPNGSMWTFGDTPQSQWINQNAHRFGFIVRYPEGKEHITKYAFEAWHLRYVGKDYAQKVFDTKLTFDEVIDH